MEAWLEHGVSKSVGQKIIAVTEAVTELHFYVSCFVVVRNLMTLILLYRMEVPVRLLSVDIDFTRLIIGVCNGARIRGLARSLKLLLLIVIMASDNLIHDDLAGMQTTCDLIRKRYTQCRLRISRPVVLRGKDQMPVFLSFDFVHPTETLYQGSGFSFQVSKDLQVHIYGNWMG